MSEMGLILEIIKQIIKKRGGGSKRKRKPHGIQIGVNWAQVGGGRAFSPPIQDARPQGMASISSLAKQNLIPPPNYGIYILYVYI